VQMVSNFRGGMSQYSVKNTYLVPAHFACIIFISLFIGIKIV
jgi:hypothetical protein